MKIHEGYENLKLVNPVVTLGIFDGVHRGHRALLDFLIKRSTEVKGESVVLTFFPHPKIIISEKEAGLVFLTSLEEKITLLNKVGIDHLIIIRFNYEFSTKTACEFVKDVLIEKIGANLFIVGHNQHFGWQGEGDFDAIKQCAGLYDLNVEQVQALLLEERAISSTGIRRALLNGQLDEANRLLGYDYFMNGSIVEGKHLGRIINFPTANIEPDYKNKLIPKDGVYAVEIHFEGIKYLGMLSIGWNPTVNPGSGPRTIEVNIFDFDKDIYGHKITIVFRFRLRDEIKFADLAQLSEQLELDKKNALQLLT